MTNPDYTIQVVHQDEGEKGWRIEIYDTANGSTPGGGDEILVFAAENVALGWALNHTAYAIRRDRARAG